MQSAYQLILGNRNTSSWSLRAWLPMTRMGLAFDEIDIDLRAPDYKQQILAHSPAGKVPALKLGTLVVWDSLAIIEHLADRYPDADIWPANADARSVARSVSAEMHAGFRALRDHCPMDFHGSHPMPTLPETVERNLRRIIEIWRDCRSRYGADGPFLFGEFSGADAMYAPVASRFRTYIPDLTLYGDDGTASAYIEAIFALPEIQAWGDDAAKEIAAASGNGNAP